MKFQPYRILKKNIYEENMDKNIQSRFLSALGVGTWKGLIAVIAIATVAGCASSAFLTIASVPNPVLLAGPSHIKTDRKDVDVEVESSRTDTYTNYYLNTTENAEGANKASFAVLKATQGNDSLDVQVSSMEVGAYFFGFPFSLGIQKNWAGIKAGVAGAGKGNKQ